jgi:lysine 6-dehydrogenase
MKNRYVVLGAGRQGRAAAYYFGKFANAAEVLLVDNAEDNLLNATQNLGDLTQKNIFTHAVCDINDHNQIYTLCKDRHAILSAVPYTFNESLTNIAIDAGAHFCDLGGNTDIVRKQLNADEHARARGVSICPDCGLAPGLGNLLAADGLLRIEKPETIKIRCGGLPLNPSPPLNYHLVFAVEGLLNEYFGKATILRDGDISEIDTFSEFETLEVAPFGTLEAAVTSGGTSTAPWSFKGTLKNYDYKTIRYPGHFEKFKVFKDLGFLSEEEQSLKGETIVPRELFKRLLELSLTKQNEKDVVIMQVSCHGEDGQSIAYKILDFHDEDTGFSAMERTTAYPAAAVLQMQVEGDVSPGAVPIERSVPTARFLELVHASGIPIEIEEQA